jgi:hypothetical protein
MSNQKVIQIVENLTENEHAVLKALYNNAYGEKGDGVWAWAVNDSHEPSGITGKSLSGVVGSLCKKGLYRSEEYDKNEWVLYTTELGNSVMKELFE